MNTITKIAALAALPTALLAETVSFNDTFSFVPNGSADVSLSQFDSNLGTLTRVTVTVNYNKTGGSAAVDNESDLAANDIQFKHTVSGSLTSSDVSLASGLGTVGGGLSAVSISAPFDLEGNDGDDVNSMQTTGNDYDTWSPTDAFESDTGNINSGSWLLGNGYIGSGNITMTVSGTQSIEIVGDGAYSLAFSPSTLSGDVTVEYEYTPSVVPEASTYSLIAGFIALGWVMARRRK